jgi:tripartite-type tricarboxylate transporter receptor subunit TctC
MVGGSGEIDRIARRRFRREETVPAKFCHAAALAIAISAAGPAFADPVADFYAGKQIRIVIRSEPGTTYEQYSRLLAAHMGQHIPGKPQIVLVFMPGGGGIIAANYVAKAAPQDGTVLSIVGEGMANDQALGLSKSFQGDLRTFNWIGNLSNSDQVLVTWHTSPTQTIADAMQRETLIGTTGAGSISVQIPAFLNNVLGTKFKIIFGYTSPNAVDLAMERGEVEGYGGGAWARYQTVTPHFIADKLINPLVQIGLAKEETLPNTPFLHDLAKRPEDQPLIDFLSKSVSFARPLATTPGVSPERVAALRKAFEATLADPDFLADVAKEHVEIHMMGGDQLAGLVGDLINAPSDVREKVKAAIEPADAQKLESAGQAAP